MKLKLIEKRVEAKGTKSFFWESEKKTEWLAGQYFYFTLPKLNYPDPRGATRHFTISSSPTEDNVLRLTTRIRKESGYKKTLDELKIGSEIEAAGPNGTFILDEKEAGNHVFIAGGIGVTPFRSMIKYAIDNNIGSKITLIYSNSTPEEIAFYTEFVDWAAKWPNLKLAITVTHPEESKQIWKGLTGRIDLAMIKKYSEGINDPTYWLCGPPAMIDGVEEVISKMKIPDNKLRTEKFTGY